MLVYRKKSVSIVIQILQLLFLASKLYDLSPQILKYILHKSENLGNTSSLLVLPFSKR